MKRPTSNIRGPFLRRIALLPEKADPDRYPFNIGAFRDGLDLELADLLAAYVRGAATALAAQAGRALLDGYVTFPPVVYVEM